MISSRMLSSAVLMAAFVALVPPGAVQGQIPEGQTGPFTPHPEGNEAIEALKSPYCPGLMLEVCPSPQAAILRDSIQMLAHEGLASDSIVEWMLANHGEEWRAVPKREGAGLWAWVLPPLALIMGVGVVVVALRRFRGSAPEREEASPLSDEERARLEEAMDEMEQLEEPLF